MKIFLSVLTTFVAVSVFSSANAADTTIEMLNKRDDGEKMVYSEDITRIDVGDTITWVPTSKGHNVEFVAGPDGFTIPRKSKNSKEVLITFDVPGIYYYWCTPHKGMGMIALVLVGDDKSNIEDITGAKALGKSKKKLAALLSKL
jgi:pseudoazurin